MLPSADSQLFGPLFVGTGRCAHVLTVDDNGAGKSRHMCWARACESAVARETAFSMTVEESYRYARCLGHHTTY